MKDKDIDIYKLFSKTFKGRKMFGFMGFGELSLMDKVNKPIKQTEQINDEENCFCEGDMRDHFTKAQINNDEETLELPEDLVNKLNKEGIMEEYICPDCKSNKIEYDEAWNDKTYWCSNCKLDDLYLEDLKTKRGNNA